MRNEQKVLHVTPVGENWEVESDAATLGQAETQCEAIELAHELAPEHGASTILIHTSDGQVQERLPVEPKGERRISEEQIAALAQRLWEGEGRPDGKAEEHWRRAEAQLRGA